MVIGIYSKKSKCSHKEGGKVKIDYLTVPNFFLGSEVFEF